MPTIQSLPLLPFPAANNNDSIILDDGVNTRRLQMQDFRAFMRPNTQVLRYNATNLPPSWLYLDCNTYQRFLIAYDGVPTTQATQQIYLSPSPRDVGHEYAVVIDFIHYNAAARTTPILQLNAPWGWTFIGGFTNWTWTPQTGAARFKTRIYAQAKFLDAGF